MLPRGAQEIITSILCPLLIIMLKRIAYCYVAPGSTHRDIRNRVLMVYSVPTGQVVPASGQLDSTGECSGVSTTDFYQLTGSVQLKLLNDSCSTKLPLPRNPPLLEM